MKPATTSTSLWGRLLCGYEKDRLFLFVYSCTFLLLTGMYEVSTGLFRCTGMTLFYLGVCPNRAVCWEKAIGSGLTADDAASRHGVYERALPSRGVVRLLEKHDSVTVKEVVRQPS